MKEINNYCILNLSLKKQRIEKIIDLKSKTEIKSFFKPLTDNVYKLYILINSEGFLYIGITRQSLRSRLNSGFNAKGEHGYHGYKWKNLNNVNLFVWIFKEFDATQLESIEAELSFLVRKQTSKWPLYQNEIHFNNDFTKGKEIATQIFEICQDQNL